MGPVSQRSVVLIGVPLSELRSGWATIWQWSRRPTGTRSTSEQPLTGPAWWVRGYTSNGSECQGIAKYGLSRSRSCCRGCLGGTGLPVSQHRGDDADPHPRKVIEGLLALDSDDNPSFVSGHRAGRLPLFLASRRRAPPKARVHQASRLRWGGVNWIPPTAQVLATFPPAGDVVPTHTRNVWRGPNGAGRR